MTTDIEMVLDRYGIDHSDKSGEQSIHCPVHEDAQASASLHLDKELFNCHACGASGSAYDIVMKREGLDFASAKRFVETITGRPGGGARSERGTRRAVPPGTGYRPRNRSKVSPRRGSRPEF